MPVAFPSHQGLLAPLWRIWPNRFCVLALWVGAMVPDIIDGVENVVVRGQFSQWLGHTLVGATAVGVPVGLALTWGLRGLLQRQSAGSGKGAGRLSRVAEWARAIDGSPRSISRARRIGFDALSVWLGALSHVLFDTLTHERSRLLWPFGTDPAWLGEGWRTVWFRVSAPGYPDYPIGPHFVAWVVLTVVGAVMFFRWPPRTCGR